MEWESGESSIKVEAVMNISQSVFNLSSDQQCLQHSKHLPKRMFKSVMRRSWVDKITHPQLLDES